jgi:transposase
MLKRSGKVYTQIVKNCSANELIPIILEQAKTGSTMFSDCWKSYNGLVDFGYKKHYRVKHGEGQYAKKELEIVEEKEVEIKNHINGIENFWGLCKVRLARFRGIKKDNFLLHLKECEFRYNNRDQDLSKLAAKRCTKFY